MGWYAKRWERSRMVGLWEMQICKNLLCENQNKNTLLIKNRTISTFFKFRKDFQNFEILNLLANFTKGVIFS